jgi:hypothetical protein
VERVREIADQDINDMIAANVSYQYHLLVSFLIAGGTGVGRVRTRAGRRDRESAYNELPD